MGRLICIGHGTLLPDKQATGSYYSHPTILTSNEVPRFGVPTDGTNLFCWLEEDLGYLLYEMGLANFFFNVKTGLMRNQPGCFIIEELHLKAIKRALADCPANNLYNSTGDNQLNTKDSKYYFSMLECLKYWINYSLENFSTPVFYNSYI